MNLKHPHLLKVKQKPLVSFVMVACNGTLSHTIRAIESIEKYTNIPYELIVVDNATYDGTTAWLKANGISYIRIPYKEPISYGAALNKGLKSASGEYLAILNNDIFVTPNWIQLMLNCFNNGKKIPGVSKVGIVGPMSNAVGYEQNVGAENLRQLGYSNQEPDILRFAENWLSLVWNSKDEFFKNKCSRTGMLVGFCWVMSRECYNAVGDFEEFDKGGYEDNDYVHRASLKGFASLISQCSFVHHECHVTFNALKYLDTRYGVINRRAYYNKWKSDGKEKKLILGKFGDGIRRDNITTFAGFEYILENNKSDLLKKLSRSGADWIILLDLKENIEPRFTVEMAQNLMNPIDPQVYAYQFRIITVWDDPKRQRIDDLFQNRVQVKMFRNLPGYGIEDGLEPSFPSHNVRVCPYRIYDYSYLNKQDRIAEFNKMSDVDKKAFECILDDYVHTIPINDNLTLALATIMKDEMRAPDYHLEDFLDLYHPLFDEMIIVDTGSADNSVEVAEFYGATVIKKQWNDDFSEMRNIALDNCKSTWILPLDFDERLGEDILRFRRWIEMPNIAYRIPIIHPIPNSNENTLTWKCRLFRNLPEIRYIDPVHEEVESSIISMKQERRIVSLPKPEGTVFAGIIHYGNNKDPRWVRAKKQHYEEMCEKIVEKNSGHGYANFSLAIHHGARGENKEAIEHLDKAIQNRPNFGLFYITACKIRVRQGEEYLAEALKHARQGSPEYMEIMSLLKQVSKIALRIVD